MELRSRHAAARRRQEWGLTLTELLVTIVVLSIIGGSIAGAFEIGLRLLGPGGAQASLTGNQDLLSLEQQLGADANRAVCFAAPKQTTVPSGGAAGVGAECTNSVEAVSTTCAIGYVLCLAWFPAGVAGATCHTISYTEQASTDVLLRIDSSASGTTTSRFSTGGLVLVATWSTATTTSGYSWVTTINVAATQLNAPGAATHPVNTMFTIAPLTADPASPVTGGTLPC